MPLYERKNVNEMQINSGSAEAAGTNGRKRHRTWSKNDFRTNNNGNSDARRCRAPAAATALSRQTKIPSRKRGEAVYMTFAFAFNVFAAVFFFLLRRAE